MRYVLEAARLGCHRRVAALALALLVSAAVPGRGFAQDADARYQGLLSAANTGRGPVDWQALRFAYADRPEFSVAGAPGEHDHLIIMRSAVRAGDFAGALREADAVIDEDFVDPEPHLVAAQACHQLGKSAEEARERTIAAGLLQSIQTGDGRSAAGAFTVISVKEEYVLMREWGLRLKTQSLREIDGHRYDVMDTVDGAGAPVTLYFQIDRAWASEGKMLSPFFPGARTLPRCEGAAGQTLKRLGLCSEW